MSALHDACIDKEAQKRRAGSGLKLAMKRTTLCYLRRADEWLMLYRNKKPHDPNAGKWIGIGGRIEPGETPDACIRREVFEETGIELRSAHFHGVIHFRSDAWEDEDMYLYSSDDFETHNELALCDEGELAWIKDKELFDLPMWEGDRLFLRQIAEGRDQISMTLSYEGDKLISASDSCS